MKGRTLADVAAARLLARIGRDHADLAVLRGPRRAAGVAEIRRTLAARGADARRCLDAWTAARDGRPHDAGALRIWAMALDRAKVATQAAAMEDARALRTQVREARR